MKQVRTKRFFAAALLAVCLLFPGCAKESRPPLLYQELVESASLTDGTRTWRLTPIPGGFSLEITSPASASGITYRLTDTGCTVSAGDVTIPVEGSVADAAKKAAALFTLSEENRVGTDRSSGGGMTARYETDLGEIAVHLDGEGIPLSFDTPFGTWTVSDFVKIPEG